MADKDFVVKNGLVTGSNTLTVGTGALTVNNSGIYRNTTLIANTTGPYGKSESDLSVANAVYAISSNSSTYSTNATFAANANYSASAGQTTYSLTFSNAGSGSTTGNTFNGSAAKTISYNSIGAAPINQTMYLGTTAVTINRASATLNLNDVTVDNLDSSYWRTVSNQLNTYPATAADATSWINYAGYNNSTGYLRHFSIGNGKNDYIAYFQATATGGNLYVKNGNITAYWTSDINLKENIRPIQNPIEKIKSISGNNFDWKDEVLATMPEEFARKHDVGVIAQEVEKVLPEVVQTRTDGTKAVAYERIVPLLIEAIKEQQKQIEELQTKLGLSTN